MHSRIFQISPQPREEVDKVDESRYYDWDIPDYVTQFKDKDIGREVLDWLGEAKFADVADDGRSFRVVNREQVLREMYETWRDNMEKSLETVTFEAFADPTAHISEWYHAKQSFSETFGLYFDDNDEYAGIMTLQDFLRYAKEGQVYNVISVLDYHW